MTDKKDVDWEHLKKKIQQVVDRQDSESKKKHIGPADWEHTKKRMEKEIKERKKEKTTKEIDSIQSAKQETSKDIFSPLHFDDIDKKLHELSNYFAKETTDMQEQNSKQPPKEKQISLNEQVEKQPKHHFEHAITFDTYERVTSHIEKPGIKKEHITMKALVEEQSWEETKTLIEKALEKHREQTKDFSYNEIRRKSERRKKVFDKDLKKSKIQTKKDFDRKSIHTKGWDVIGRAKLRVNIKKGQKSDTSSDTKKYVHPPEIEKPQEDTVSSIPLSYMPTTKKVRSGIPTFQKMRDDQEKRKKHKERHSRFDRLKPHVRVTINPPKLSLLPVKHFIMENLVELTLSSIGLYFLLTMQPSNMRIGFTLLLIASFMMFLMVEGIKSTDYSVDSRFFNYLANSPRKQASLFYIKEKKYNPDVKTSSYLYKRIINVIPSLKNIYERIHYNIFKKYTFSLSDRIAIILIAWTLFLFVITSDLEIYFILIFIGILITKELTDIYTTDAFKTRLNAYIVFFLVTYIILIYQKVMQILQS